MTTVVLGLAGQALFGPFGGFVGGLIGGFIDRAIFAEDQVIEGPRRKDLQVTGSAYGSPIPILVGTARMGSNVVWSTGLVEHRIEHESGGKGPSVTTVEYQYSASWRSNFCRIKNPPADFLKILLDTKTIADKQNIATFVEALQLKASGSSFAGELREYKGTLTQEPDPDEQADRGVMNTPAYRRQAGLVFVDWPLEDFGNRVPQISAVVSDSASDLFPRTSVTTTFNPSQNAYNRLSPDGRFMWRPGNTGTVAKIDIINGTVLFEGQDPVGNESAGGFVEDTISNVDPITGDFYFTSHTNPGESNPTDATVHGYDPNFQLINTLGPAVIEESDIIDGEVNDIIVVATPVGSTVESIESTKFVRTLVVSSWREEDGLAKIWFFRIPLAAVEGETIDSTIGVKKLSLISSFLADEIIGSSGQPLRSQGMAVDNTGGRVFIHIQDVEPFADHDSFFIECSITGAVLNTYVHGRNEALYLAYYEDENALLFLDRSASLFCKYDLDDGTLTTLAVNTSQQNSLDNEGRDAFRNYIGTGSFWLAYDNGTANEAVQEIDPSGDMQVLREVDLNDWGGSRLGVFYAPSIHALISNNGTTVNIDLLDRLSAGDITLSTVIDAISDEAGYDSSDWDASALTDNLRGYVMANRAPARVHIDTLMKWFMFNVRQEDWQIEYLSGGGASAITIDEDDLGTRENPDEVPIKLKRGLAHQLDLPQRVEVNYQDPSQDYQPNMQPGSRDRDVVKTRRRLVLSADIALSNDQAKQLADKLVRRRWTRRQDYEWTLPLKYLRLSPGDVATIPADGSTYTVLVEEAIIGINGVLAYKGVADAAADYASSRTGIGNQDFPSNLPTVIAPPKTFVMELPPLARTHAGFLIYSSAGGYGETFPGTSILQSTDMADWSGFSAIPRTAEATWGIAEGALADTDCYQVIHSDTVTVQLFAGSLSSATDTQLRADRRTNTALLGQEIIRYGTVQSLGSDRYTLTVRFRGRLGTEWAVGLHKARETFVQLQEGTLESTQVSTDLIGEQRFYRGIAIGAPLYLGDTITKTIEGVFLKPIAPSMVSLTKEGNGDITIDWKRRDPYHKNFRRGSAAPVPYSAEKYYVRILETTEGSPDDFVYRTITVTDATTATYTAAQQTTDFGAQQLSARVDVAQVNTDVTPELVGYRREATLTGTGTLPTFVAKATDYSVRFSSGATFSAPPAGIQAGDHLICVMSWQDDTRNPTPDTGFQEIFDQSAGNTCRLAAYIKKATADDVGSPTASYSFALSGSTDSVTATLFAVRNAEAVDIPIGRVSTRTNSLTSIVIDPIHVAETPVLLIGGWGAINHGDMGDQTPPSDFTEIADVAVSGSAGTQVMASYAIHTTEGSTGSFTGTSVFTNNSCLAFLFDIRPA